MKKLAVLMLIGAAAAALLLTQVSAQSSVVINEVLWSGTAASASDEYIELSGAPGTDLSGWTLAAIDGSPSIALTGVISTTGFYLLERTDDNTVAGVAADQLYSGSLSNGGEVLELRDAGGNLVDTVDGSAGWPGGSSSPRAAMERQAGGGYSTNDCVETSGALDALGGLICGTPGAANATEANPAPAGTPVHLPIILK